MKNYLISLIESIEYNNLLTYSVVEFDGKTTVKFNDSTAEYNHMNHIVYKPTEEVVKEIFTNIQKDKEFSISFKLNKRTTVYLDYYPQKRIFLSIHQFDIKANVWYNIEDETAIEKIDKLVEKYKEI